MPEHKTVMRHVAAFHVKPGPLDIADTLKRLRQIRHGLEDHPDTLSEPLQDARNSVDNAITSLKKHLYMRDGQDEVDNISPHKRAILQQST